MTQLSRTYVPSEARPAVVAPRPAARQPRRISFPKAFGSGLALVSFLAAIGAGVAGGIAPDYLQAREWFRAATVCLGIGVLGMALFLSEFLREEPLLIMDDDPRLATWVCVDCGRALPMSELHASDGMVCADCDPPSEAA